MTKTRERVWESRLGQRHLSRGRRVRLQRAPHNTASPLLPGSTSLALINCRPCFFFPRDSQQWPAETDSSSGMMGVDRAVVSHPPEPVTSSSLPWPVDLFHSPVGGSGARLAALGEGARPRWVSYCRSQDAVNVPGFVMLAWEAWQLQFQPIIKA